ncbi:MULTISPECIES: hypothetical protein [Streptomyces]|uniref:Phosphatidic acid phosphatase type 2/haloperoxidase domain-containing protein n=1 Tax=Streptomyces chlorus TaxID=887452 RepID=A0ABW1E0T3_9ACTN|nr:hypothetical protein [Streptomyces hirsutus]
MPSRLPAADHAAGVAWGVVGALFAAVIPTLFINSGIRHGHWGDRHVGARTARLVVMAFILASITAGTALMAALGAPRTMTALVVAMFTTLAGLTAVTFTWKISVHAAVASGSIALLTLTYGPWPLAAYPLVALVSWSRTALRDHTPAQVASGALLGAVLARVTFAAVR